MIKAMIFDFDGTIIDTESLWFKVYKEVLHKEYDVELPLEEFVKVIGTTDEALVAYINNQSKKEVDHVELNQRLHERFQSLKSTLVLRDGVKELMNEANKLGLEIAIASSSGRKWVEDFLIRFQIRDYFKVIKTKEDVLKVKPSPELYMKAVKDIGINPYEAIAIEDSVNGSIAAIKAGLSTVIVPNDVTSLLEFDARAQVYKNFSEVKLSEIIKK
ncbi:HAD family hydrolase [Bacillus massilinigeriensis]|uniref:HAD family hydrolase n=1 Tax=Bacillus massilionigeriensis TaxID=1805475 RepID=UPI00096B00B0|nr:HAD-IA family hydrolase [Bacillus massilionigeriensis]